MRLRKAVRALLGLGVCAVALVPSSAQAAKHSSPNGRHNISIRVSDNPVTAGDQLVIFGRLTGPNRGHRVVTLWHRINPRPRFTPIQQTTTDANGFYAFFRQNGIVNTNRNWYVRSLGARSRTVHEKVFSLVTLTGPADGSNLLTGPAHRVTFSGTVSPFTVGDRVLLQRQASDTGSGNHWNTIDRSRVQPGGTFTIPHTFRVPGDASIRVLVKGTRRNLPSPSSVLTYEISQAQNPALTINASANPITIGQSVTLTGTLQNGANQNVVLLAKRPGGQFQTVAQAPADANGNYSFTQVPTGNTIYQAQGGNRKSAQLFEGVRDSLTAVASATNVQAGQPVTFSGTVAPDKTGHVIYLQREGPNGLFHTVQVSRVGSGSAYSITRRLFVAGTKTFRVFIPGGPFNQGAASSNFVINVAPASAQQVNGDQPNSDSAG